MAFFVSFDILSFRKTIFLLYSIFSPSLCTYVIYIYYIYNIIYIYIYIYIYILYIYIYILIHVLPFINLLKLTLKVKPFYYTKCQNLLLNSESKCFQKYSFLPDILFI